MEEELDPEGCICISGICFRHGLFSQEQWEVTCALMDAERATVTWHYTHLDWSKFKNKASITRKLRNSTK